jgi:hypothetical protein
MRQFAYARGGANLAWSDLNRHAGVVGETEK